ncbi:calcium-binding protein [Terasakiella sp. A23]|uniref:calcium-binding protein n=1 Tax=Terasakiella sp. FCG-A23 TaxID=3080561 RepID=UPI002952F494|nr:calcium-binding protein [Terasakiella sp. A23]MDV7340367.1 calcium-binding protein [Terasakiella sp. A23]
MPTPTELLNQANRQVGLSDPSLAVGLSGVVDWSTQMAFLDIAKMMRPWSTSVNGQYHTYEDLEEGGYFADGVLDENGWPTEIPAGLDGLSTLWAWGDNQNDTAATSRIGRYVVNYEGEGTLSFAGDVTIINEEPGRIVFDNTRGDTMILSITDTDPNDTGNYIRDISIVNEDHLALHEAGALFNPDWIDLIEDMREFRFMDWMDTNNSTTQEWTDYTSLDAYTYFGQPPIETIVALGNQTGTDIWLNIPHFATDELITNLATYVRDNFDPALKVTVEFSNEMWNSAFGHTVEFDQIAMEVFPDAYPYEARLNYFGQRTADTMKIWTDVFGDETADRLVRVAGSMTDNTWVSEQILYAPYAEQQGDPDFEPPHTYFDALAVTTYFGGAIVTDETQFNNLVAAIEDPNVDAFAYLADQLRDPTVDSSIPQVLEALAQQRALVDRLDMDLLAYEGGQHVHHFFATSGNAAQITDFMIEFVRSDHMADLYQDLWDGWAEVGTGPFMQFGDVGEPGLYGSWSMYEDLANTNPRAELLEELNATTTLTWEDRGGDHFQQGVIEEGTASADTLIGTTQEDFLIGSDGDDTLVGGLGNDGLHGGDGQDHVILNGSVEDYSFTAIENGYLSDGLDGLDRLIDIEYVDFSDGSQLQLDTGEITPPEEDPGETPPEDPQIFIGTAEAQQFVGTDAIDTVSYKASENRIVLDLATGEGRKGDADGDTYENIANIIGADHEGEGDFLRGDDADNVIMGLNGHDNIAGGGGADTLDGGEGWDFLSYSSSGEGVTIDLTTGTGHGGDAEGDVLSNFEGIEGSYHDDILIAGNDGVFLTAGEGNDTLVSGSGDDAMMGGLGADTFVLQGAAMDIIKDFNQEDGDMIDISAFLNNYDETRDDLSNFVQITQEGTSTIISIDESGSGHGYSSIATLWNTQENTSQSPDISASLILS